MNQNGPLKPPGQHDAVKVPLKRLPHARGLPLPRHMSNQAAGMDLCAAIKGTITLQPGEYRRVETGFCLAIPPGIEGQIRPRSGLALCHGITLLNSPGTIDADFRGEICVLLINLGSKPFTLKRGDRIGQLVLAPVVRTEWVEQPNLDATPRGSGGFGHTGVGSDNGHSNHYLSQD